MHLSERNALVDRYAYLAEVHASRVPGLNQDDRDDLTSLLLLRLVHQVETWEPGGSALKTWILGGLRWETQEYFRNRGGMGKVAWQALEDPGHRHHLGALMLHDPAPIEDALDAPDPTQDPFEEACQRMQAEAIRHRLSWLPTRERRVVKRYFFGDEPLARIARREGVSETTAQADRVRALDRLRRFFGGCLPDKTAPIQVRVAFIIHRENYDLTRPLPMTGIAEELGLPPRSVGRACWHIRAQEGKAVPRILRQARSMVSGAADPYATALIDQLARATKSSRAVAQKQIIKAQREAGIPRRERVTLRERAVAWLAARGISLYAPVPDGTRPQLAHDLECSRKVIGPLLLDLRRRSGIRVLQACADRNPREAGASIGPGDE